MINVLLQSRLNLFSKPGGDTIQIMDLKERLNHKGLRAKISLQLSPKLDGYHIVHLFNITRVHETYLQMINAKKQAKPVICTTIYHDLKEYNRKGRYGLPKHFSKLIKGNGPWLEYARGLFNLLQDRRQIIPILTQWSKGYRTQQEMVLINSDKIIFNSISERNKVFSHFNRLNKLINYDIIHIGVPQNFQNSDPTIFKKKHGLKDFILCVGRIEALKNQLRLISAMENKDIPIVLIGSLNFAHRAYCKKILKLVKQRKNLYYFPYMKRHMLSSAFAAAKVHALPSWFETTGLSSIEAGLADCNVVSTNRGYAHEYLKDFAWYCDPSDTLSIRDAVTDAYFSSVKSDLKKHIKNNLNIEKTVEKTINTYQEVLSK